MVRHSPFRPLNESIRRDCLLPCPRRDLAQENFERPKVNPSLNSTLRVDLYSRLVELVAWQCCTRSRSTAT